MSEFLFFDVSHDGQPPVKIQIRGGLRIGRSDQNDIPLADTRASEFHAVVVAKDGEYFVQDLGSTNFTHIFNGPSLKEGESWPIVSGAKFKCGDTEFEVFAVNVDSEPTVSQPEEPQADQGDQEDQTIALRQKELRPPEPDQQVEPEIVTDTEGPKIDEPPRRRGSPLDLPRDGRQFIGALRAPEADLAPGENNRPTTAEQFPRIDTATLEHALGGKKAGLGGAKDAAKDRANKGPDALEDAKTSGAFPVPSEPKGSQLPSEGKTSASRVPVVPARIDSESENTTTGLDINDMGRAPLAKLPGESGGPDPDEPTILSAPPAPDLEAATKLAGPRPKIPGGADNTTDQAVVPKVIDDGGDATVLSPVISENAVAKTKRSAQSQPVPEKEKLSSVESTVLSPKSPAGGPLSDRDKRANEPTRAQPAMVALEQRLELMRPRLVFCHDFFKFVAKISNDEFTIGRASQRKAVNVDCAVDHSSVSASHAAVLHRDGWFFLEDRDSRNGTTVAGRELQPMTRAKLNMDMAVKIGVIDALFIVDLDHKLAEPDRSHYRPALEYLVRQKIIRTGTAKDLWQAHMRDRQHPGEKLILEGRIRVAQWIDALNAAQCDPSLSGDANHYWRTLSLATSAIAVAMAALYVYLAF